MRLRIDYDNREVGLEDEIDFGTLELILRNAYGKDYRDVVIYSAIPYQEQQEIILFDTTDKTLLN